MSINYVLCTVSGAGKVVNKRPVPALIELSDSWLRHPLNT